MTRASISILTAILMNVGAAQYGHAATGNSENMELIGRWGGGSAYASDVVGDVAYWGNGAYLEIHGFSDPTTPVRLGRVLMPGPIRGVAVAGDHAYLAVSSDGLRVVDVSEPATAHEVGALDTPSLAFDVEVVGSHAFVADGPGGLRIIDVTDPTLPVETGFLDTAGSAMALTISGSHAYLADAEDGLRILDVSSPAAPVEVGFFDTDGSARDVVVSHPYAYVADRHEGLLVIDVGVPTAPTPVGSLYTGYIVNVGLGNGSVYTSGQVFLGVIDVSDPANPVQVGAYDPLGRLNGGITVAGEHAYVADSFYGLFAVDVSDPTAPFESGGVVGNAFCYDVAVNGDHAYLALYAAGVRILDVSDPSAPLEVGHLPYAGIGAAQRIVVRSNEAYVVGQGGSEFVIVDVTNPQTPIVAGLTDLPGRGDGVAVQGNHAYVVSNRGSAGGEDFFVVDVSNPAAPAVIASLDLASDDKREVMVAGDYAYVAAFQAGLRIVDVSDPTAPYEVGAEPTHLALGVAVDGDHAYVGTGGNLMTIVNVSDPSTPVPVGAASAPSPAAAVDVADGYAYLTTYDWGVRAFHVADPTSPSDVGHYDTGDSARQVVLHEGLAYVADWNDGLWIIELAVPANEVPDGSDIPGQGLAVAKAAGGQLLLTWQQSCLSTDTDYAVYEGRLGSFDSHVPSTCSTGGALSAVVSPMPESAYYLAVPRNLTREGSHGRSNVNGERDTGPDPCRTQAIGDCAAASRAHPPGPPLVSRGYRQ